MDICEAVDVFIDSFNSCSMNLNVDVVVQTEKADKSVATEDGGDIGVASGLKTALEISVDA